MKIAFRLALLVAAAALGFWLWAVLFPSPEKVVLKKIAGLATTATFSVGDGNITRAAKVANLIGFFAVDAEINLDAPGSATRTLSGRDEIRDTARAGFSSLAALKVEFLDVSVRLGAGKMTADVNCTARVTAGDKKDFGVQEMRFHFKKVDGDWLITRAETVKTLQ
jgi:hypothetical protein